MIEESMQEQEEFPESKPAEKERLTDRILTRKITLKGITFQMVDFYSLPFYIGIFDQMEVNAD